MKLLKKYKWFIWAFFFLLLILGVWVGKDLMLSQEGALYGHRLEGIEEVQIADATKNDISEYLLSIEGIDRVNTNVHGKIFNIVIFVDEEMTIDRIKEVADNAIQKCSEEQKNFYDISFLIDYAESSKKTDFPIIGYKNKNSDEIVW